MTEDGEHFLKPDGIRGDIGQGTSVGPFYVLLK